MRHAYCLRADLFVLIGVEFVSKRSPPRAAMYPERTDAAARPGSLKDGEIGLEEFEREGERLLDRLYVARACFAPRVIEGDTVMDSNDKAVLAAAVVGGYALGRTKKGRMALSIATYLAGR